MKSRLLQRWEGLRSSYWFVPTLMVLGAAALSAVMVGIDHAWGDGCIKPIPWLSANSADGARALLASISGSMITVAGVTFSITIAAVAYAAAQFGPRLLTNFMRDRGNQFTLGTFIATFVYCLLVLRSIRGGGDGDVLFVPHVAILFGVMLALMSVAVLIYFIHHVPESIHASNVIAAVGNELDALIQERYPACEPAPSEASGVLGAPPELPAGFNRDGARVRSRVSGYIEYLDEDALMELAAEHKLLLRLEYRVGDFVTRTKALAIAWPPENVDSAVARRLELAFALGRHRTPRQDVLFLAQELVEIAARALSPGVNDPFTAVGCLNWLQAGLTRLGERDMPGIYRADSEGNLRLIRSPIGFSVVAETVFGQLRPYVQADRNACLHAMRVIGELVETLRQPDHLKILREHAERLHRGAMQALDEDSAGEVDGRFRVVLRLLNEPEAFHEIASDHDWLSGRRDG
jgi:uncharacterized membrane protein